MPLVNSADWKVTGGNTLYHILTVHPICPQVVYTSFCPICSVPSVEGMERYCHTGPYIMVLDSFWHPKHPAHCYPEGSCKKLWSLIQHAHSIPLTISIVQISSQILRGFYKLLHLLVECTLLCKHLSIQSYGWTKEVDALEPQQLQRLKSVSLSFHWTFPIGAKVDVFSRKHHKLTCGLIWIRPAGISFSKNQTQSHMGKFP